ncbi:glutaredoxin family protein [Shewanella sp. Isolate7]|uniref:glutaredoxin family protein n=1 Tax=Shewanella sp. Isolate7 TaxID=2908528 RepID=UPI001EFD6850|nr:glutaredoxin family protein [Shewanella sp. Isolate7]MCG9723430.1 glutaredoxin family protein [Shewanella sp. Isolate7]
MPNTSTFILFHTDACHLCEQAQALISTLNIDFVLQDICDDEQLAQRYGVRIPVLLRQADGAELGWPFDNEQLQQFTGA